jgi:hypothetical protein
VISRGLAILLVVTTGCSARPRPPEQHPPGPFVIRGTVKFKGDVPKRKPLHIEGMADLPVGGILRDDLVVDADSNIRWAFVFVKRGLEQREFPPAPAPVALNPSGLMYEPHVLGVRVGQTLLIRNEDQVLHSPHPLPALNPGFGFASPVLKELRFSRPEIMIPLRCDVHPWMKAWIGVLDHPFFAVTDESGEFELRNLPAGKYTIGVWHERLTIKDQELVLSGDATLDFIGTLK